MSDECDKMKRQIADVITGVLSEPEVHAVEQHLTQCVTCGDYARALKQEDQLLTELFVEIDANMASRQERVLAALNRSCASKQTHINSVWRTIVRSPIVKLAAVAVIVIAVSTTIKVLSGPGEEASEKIVEQQDIPGREDVIKMVKDENRDSDVVVEQVEEKVERELKRISQMVAAGNVGGLVAMLSEAAYESKVVAANYLAKIGDLSAVEVLEKLSAELGGNEPNNPFAAAVEEIKERFEDEKQESVLIQGSEGVDRAVSPGRETSATAEEKITYRGVVKNAAGEVIEGVVVRSNLCLTGALEFAGWEAEGRTDGEGRFEIGPLVVVDNKEGSRTLLFEHPDYAIGWFKPYQSRDVEANAVKVTLLEPAIVSGRVMDENDNPIEGAMVEADLQLSFPSRFFYISMSRLNNMAVMTDADGRFVIEKIPEGARLHIYVSKRPYVPYASREVYRGDMHPIRTGEDLQIVLEYGGAIKGRLVLDGKDYEKKGITVIAQGADQGWAKTDEHGQFEITGLREGSYTVGLHTDSMANEDLVCRAVSDYSVKVGEVGPDIQLELQEGLPVTVKVIDENTEEPVGGVWLRAALPDNKSVAIGQGTTDVGGKCVIRLMPGGYTLLAQGWKNGQFHQFTKDFSVDADSEELSVEIAITPRPFICGWLVDANDNPVRGTITLGHHKPAQTDENGEFAIEEPWWRPGETHIGYAFDTERTLGRAFFWKKNDEANDLEIVVEPLTTIVGQVVDANGVGVGDVKPRISILLGHGMSTSSSNNPWKMTVEPDGWFIFEGVPVGLPMKVSVHKPGYYGSAGLPELKAGETVQADNMLLKPVHSLEDPEAEWTGSISGRVINENNEPMVGLRVYSDAGAQMFQDVTDTKGRYTLSGLPVGEKMRVSVYVAGYGHCSGKVVVDGNDFDLQIFPQGWDLLDKEAPGLLVEKWLNTEPITLEQYRGEVVLLQISALLPNYLHEFDRIQKLLKKYGDEGLEVIAVHEHLSVTWAGQVTEEDLRAFIKKHNVKFPFGIDGPHKTHFLYGVKATPALYLVDKKGILRVSPTRDNIDEWIKRLLAE